MTDLNLCKVILKKESTGEDIYEFPKKLNSSEIAAINVSNTIEDKGIEYEIANLSFDYRFKTLNIIIRD